MNKPPKHDPQWAEAKRRCRLNMEDIRMAKELGLSPKGLMKNVPNKNQQWKLPVKFWIHELHEKRFGRKRTPQRNPTETPAAAQAPGMIANRELFDDVVPF